MDVLPSRFGERILSFHRVVNDDNVATTPGQRSADRGGHPKAPARSSEFVLVIAAIGNFGGWKYSLIEARAHQLPTASGMSESQAFGIASADEAELRIVPQRKRGERDRRADRF